MKTIKQLLLDLTYQQIKAIWAQHLLWAKENKRTSGNPKWFDEPGTLNVIGIDCDSNSIASDNEIEFNLGKYKDVLMLIYNNPSGSFDQVLINVTVDPETDKYGRMNLMPGVYDAYRVGIHGLSTGLTSVYIPEINKSLPRYALRQDKNKVYVARTDGSGKGKVIKFEWSMSYSNIHNPGKSAGCTVTESNEAWFKKLLPYLYDYKTKKIVPKNAEDVTYSLMHYKQLEQYAGELVIPEAKAEAVDPTETKLDPESKPATRSKEGGAV